MNEQNTREAAMYEYLYAERKDENVEPVTFGYDRGFRDGAASVDRVAIVRRIEDAKQRLQMALSAKNLPYAQERATEALADLDAVLGEMEKGK